MGFTEEAEALRHYLDELASNVDTELIDRYELKRPTVPPGLYWRLRWIAGWALRYLRSVPIWRPDPWPAGLKQAVASSRARPLLIWAVGTDRGTLRDACDVLSKLRTSLPGFAPVVVTDLADFAYFSRLGWLVEYVPRLTGKGEAYDRRKMRFLARLYQGAPALPMSACEAAGRRPDEIERWIAQ